MGVGRFRRCAVVAASAVALVATIECGDERSARVAPPRERPVSRPAALELDTEQLAPDAATAVFAPAETVEVSVTATPAAALIYFDETLLDGDPPTIRVPRDGSEHVVRVVADGYEARELAVETDADVHIVLSLDRRERRMGRRSSPRDDTATVPSARIPLAAVRARAAPEPEPAELEPISGGLGGRDLDIDRRSPWNPDAAGPPTIDDQLPWLASPPE